MTFDEIDNGSEKTQEVHFMKPSRSNLDLLLDMNYKDTARTFLIVLIQTLLAYLILNIWLKSWGSTYYWWYFSIFVAIGLLVDQLVSPDENTKFGYFVLLLIYYLIYKVVVFGAIAYVVLLFFDLNYEVHFFEEGLPAMIAIVFWAIGQKIGYYFEHHKLLDKVNFVGADSLNDIDKLKIFLYQVGRRSFLRMLIQRNKAKFYYLPSNPWKVTPTQMQIDSRLAELDMANFLKLLKIRKLPESKYISFDQITEIDFSKNKIKKFSTSIFRIFPNVRFVDLSNNKIMDIHIGRETEQQKYFDGTVVMNFEGNPGFT